MKIGIVSDTHGCLTTWREIFRRHLADVDLIIHAGDVLYHGPRNPVLPEYEPRALAEELNRCPVPIVAACGNCDAEVDGLVLDLPVQAPYAYLVVEGRRFVVNHGHNLTEVAGWATAARMKVSVLITGHTHQPLLEKRNGIIWLNPGSPVRDLSKRPDGRGTLARIEDGKVAILDWTTAEVLAREEL